MPKFIDFHESLPPMPPEMMAQAKAGIEARAVNEFGSKGLNLFMGTDGSAYCLSRAPDADAVLKSHQALGIPQTLRGQQPRLGLTRVHRNRQRGRTHTSAPVLRPA